MKELQIVDQLLDQSAPFADPVSALNTIFGRFGWEWEWKEMLGITRLKVMLKVSDGQFITIVRECPTILEAAETFGIKFTSQETSNGKSEPTREILGNQEVQQTLPQSPVGNQVPKSHNRKTINESITAFSQVCLVRKIKTQDELIARVQAFGVKRKEELTDDQALELLSQLKELCK